MQFRKVMQFVRLRLVPSFVAGILLVSPLSLCARAAEWTGSASVGYTHWGPNDGLPYQESNSITLPSGTAVTGKVGRTLNGTRVQISDVSFSSPVSIYISSYFRRTAGTIEEVGNPYDLSNYEISFQYEDTESKGYGDVKEALIFTPNVEEGSFVVGSGITLSATAPASSGRPIKNILLRPIKECGWIASGGVSTNKGSVVILSCRVIGAESAEELAALDNVANEIIEGNEILEAMKGDVVALLQDIYTVTMDIEIAADRTNDILSELLEVISDTNVSVDAIYSLFSSFVDLIGKNHEELISLLEQNHSDIMYQLTQIVSWLCDYEGTEIGNAIEKTEEGAVVQDGLGELQKPDYESFDFDTDGYVDQFDGGSGDSTAALNGFFGVLFDNSLITSMLMVTLSFAMVAYVLYGKR